LRTQESSCSRPSARPPSTPTTRGGSVEEALLDWNDALELSPDNPELLERRAKLLDRLNRHEEARRDLDRLAEIKLLEASVGESAAP